MKNNVVRNIPTLKEFMLKRTVIQLYRDFFRATKDISDEKNRKEVQDWIRSDFKSKKGEKDEYAIKLLIQNGQIALRELRSNIALTR